MDNSFLVTLDERTNRELDLLSQSEGIAPSEMASRLLRRMVRARRPRPIYDVTGLRAVAQSFAEEDSALADSDSEYRAGLLQYEDTAP